MRLKARLQREWRFLRGLNRTLKRVKSIASDSPNLICDDLQAAVEQWRDRPAMTFEGRTLSYGELDAMANRYAHWGKGLNLRRGLLLSRGDPSIFIERPISATLLAMTALLLAWTAWGALRKRLGGSRPQDAAEGPA